jgi:hypothetical protein
MIFLEDRGCDAHFMDEKSETRDQAASSSPTVASEELGFKLRILSGTSEGLAAFTRSLCPAMAAVCTCQVLVQKSAEQSGVAIWVTMTFSVNKIPGLKGPGELDFESFLSSPRWC